MPTQAEDASAFKGKQEHTSCTSTLDMVHRQHHVTGIPQPTCSRALDRDAILEESDNLCPP